MLLIAVALPLVLFVYSVLARREDREARMDRKFDELLRDLNKE